MLAYFYPTIRRVYNNFGSIPSKKTFCKYLEEQKNSIVNFFKTT